MIVEARAQLSPQFSAHMIELMVSIQLPKKLDVLWSFIKSHLKSKCVVFLSSCKQVDDNTKPPAQEQSNRN